MCERKNGNEWQFHFTKKKIDLSQINSLLFLSVCLNLYEFLFSLFFFFLNRYLELMLSHPSFGRDKNLSSFLTEQEVGIILF